MELTALHVDSLPLQQKKHEMVRREIWSAALGLFARDGFEATTVGQIASAAGISPRTFFRYFASKEDVILQGVDAYGNDLVTEVRALPPGPPSLDAICRALTPLAESYIQSEPHVKTVMRIVCESPALRAAQMMRFRTVEARIAAQFELRMGEGPDASPRASLLASVTLAALNIALDAWQQEGGEVAPLVEEMFAVAKNLG